MLGKFLGFIWVTTGYYRLLAWSVKNIFVGAPSKNTLFDWLFMQGGGGEPGVQSYTGWGGCSGDAGRLGEVLVGYDWFVVMCWWLVGGCNVLMVVMCWWLLYDGGCHVLVVNCFWLSMSWFLSCDNGCFLLIVVMCLWLFFACGCHELVVVCWLLSRAIYPQRCESSKRQYI